MISSGDTLSKLADLDLFFDFFFFFFLSFFRLSFFFLKLPWSANSGSRSSYSERLFLGTDASRRTYSSAARRLVVVTDIVLLSTNVRMEWDFLVLSRSSAICLLIELVSLSISPASGADNASELTSEYSTSGL